MHRGNLLKIQLEGGDSFSIQELGIDSQLPIEVSGTTMVSIGDISNQALGNADYYINVCSVDYFSLNVFDSEAGCSESIQIENQLNFNCITLDNDDTFTAKDALFRIFPNPTSDLLFVNGVGVNNPIEIYNTEGKLVLGKGVLG